MREQIYVGRQKSSRRRREREATVGPAVWPKGFLWWSVLFPSGFITLLSRPFATQPGSERDELHREGVDPAHLPPQIK